MIGLSPEQQDCFAVVRCQFGHRFDGVNYPTPEGLCPRCAYPEVQQYIDNYQRLLAAQASQRNDVDVRRHQSVGLHMQAASPSLTASSES